MGPNVECPNPKCGKMFVVLDRMPFRCTSCGTHIEVEVGERIRQKHDADDRTARIRRQKLRKARYLLIPLGLGLIFHEIGFYAVILSAIASVWLTVAAFRRSRLLLPKAILVFVLLFVAGSIVGEILFPATAICSDGTLSFSAHDSGTCSWHGGVSEWHPSPWWSR
jgi:Protein of unknown function (DUF3761)